MRNKKTIKEFRAFYIMASSVYAKSSRKRKEIDMKLMSLFDGSGGFPLAASLQ